MLHFWWGIPHSLGVRQGHEGSRSCPWHWVASAAWRWYSPLSHSMCLNGKAGWWVWAATWGVFRLQIGSSRSGARLTAQTLSLCPEDGCGYWAAITRQLCQCEPGGRMRRKIQWFFSQNNNPFLPHMDCVNRRVAHLNNKLLGGCFYPSGRAKI